MIDRPTVLILGAGASVHIGYPLGGILINDLVKRRGRELLPNFLSKRTTAQVDQFLVRLSRSGHYSIDAFLETVPDQAEIGKYFLASEINRHENIESLFPPSDSGWYQYLFNRLLNQRGEPAFAESKLSIITFNYDRSLEVYLHEALRARFELSVVDANAILSDLPIIHVHGSLGSYPEVPYQQINDLNELLRISQQIQIIHELSDQDGAFCSVEFEKANQLLQSTERIFFLGFGFHSDNIRRFRFFTPENTKERELFASTYGMGSVDQQELIQRLHPLGFPKTAFNGNPCNRFFTHFVLL